MHTPPNVEVEPEGHGEHCPAIDKVSPRPSGHGVHSPPATPEVVPGLQGKHLPPAEELNPTGQGEHDVEPEEFVDENPA